MHRTQRKYKNNILCDASSCYHPLEQSFHWLWPPGVTYEASEEESLIKPIGPPGQGKRHWYRPLRYDRWPLHLVQTAALDSCCTPTQRGRSELRLSTCRHTNPSFVVFSAFQSSCQCLCLSGTRGKGRRERSWKSFWETIRGVMIKQRLLTAQRETRSQSLGLLRHGSDEINSQFCNVAIEKTKENSIKKKRTKQRSGKSGFGTQQKK